eukprot:SAG22_NODE_273_length_13182_cov_12.693419_9_plen_59_part_00
MFHEGEQNHGEYDVVQCVPGAGTPGCVDCDAGADPRDCVHEIVGKFPLSEAMHKCNDR